MVAIVYRIDECSLSAINNSVGNKKDINIILLYN